MPLTITSDGGLLTAAISADENQTAVTTVTAEGGVAALTFSLVSGADKAKFAIDPVTGVLTFIGAPDFENATDVGKNNVYDVVVRVTDGTSTVEQTIAVTVQDVLGATLVGSGADEVFWDPSTPLPSQIGETVITGIDFNTTSEQDTIFGGAGNDIINGGVGADAMSGGDGDDIYFVDNVGDTTVEEVGEGNDIVLSSVSYTLADNVEGLELQGTAAINATGNSGNNVIFGNSGANIIDGGEGEDAMIGQGGNDTYHVDNILDIAVEEVGGGTDTVISTLHTTALNDFAWLDEEENVVVSNIEKLTLGTGAVQGSGNALSNTITGNEATNYLFGLEGNDTLDGGAGADWMEGGIGNDLYKVDDVNDAVIEYADEGLDTVEASVSYELYDFDVENLVLTGSDTLTGTGNNNANHITGNTGANTLYGKGGNDTLVGGAGADVMYGGGGADTYAVENVLDQVIELAGQGIDTVLSRVSFTLGDNVENLELIAGSNVNATGNDLNNRLTGNIGKNTLDGKGGNDILNGGNEADIMIGGTGDDYFYVNRSDDQVIEFEDEGIDTVSSSFSYTLSEHLENLVLTTTLDLTGTGNANDNSLTGNSGKNTLTGFAGNDILNGKVGADTMIGGEGDDTYHVDNAGDVVTEIDGEGYDTVISTAANYTLAEFVEAVTLGSYYSTNATGNDADNVMTGNAGKNILLGGAGDDIINGGGGVDRLDGGEGSDILTGGAGKDRFVFEGLDDLSATQALSDFITDFTSGTDKIDLRLLDANVDVADDQAFVLDKDRSFSQGEVAISTDIFGRTILLMNTDADQDAEFVITFDVGTVILGTDIYM